MFLALVLLATPVAAQDHVLCTTTAAPPFTVTSGSPFTVQWIMPDTTTENGQTVPNRWNGFYVQIDNGPKADIGLATVLTACSSGSPRPGDFPHTYRTTAGVTKGNHTLKLSAWSFTLDGAGNPTTTRQESTVASIPFDAVDPILTGPPVQPSNVLIVR